MTGRQIDILCYLYGMDDYVTISEISEVIQVSVKTIRNDLNAIQEELEQLKLGALIKKPHAGVRLEMGDEDWEKLQRIWSENSEAPDALDAKYRIIYMLLEKGSVSFHEIQKALYVGRAAVDKLVPDLQKWFERFGIVFEKKKGKGFQIEFREFDWRLAMWSVFLTVKRKSRRELFGNPHLNGEHAEYAMIEDFLKGFDSTGVNKEIYSLEEYYGFSLGYESHIQMFFLLSLCIVRSRKRQFAELPQTAPCKVTGTYSDMIKGRLIAGLERAYDITLVAEEREFVRFVIEISEIQRFLNYDQMLVCQRESMELCSFTIRLISLVSGMVNVNLRKDNFFVEGLFLQLRSMIARLRYGIYMENPLLKQVKQKYPNIFAVVYGISVYFEKELGLNLNEHEMCNLALLLGGALERSLSTVTACVICDYGIGISQLLREQIERTISDIRILDVLSMRDMRKVNQMPCDLVITTLQMKTPYYGKEVIVVDHLMTQYDIKNIENAMKQIRRKKLKTRQPCNQLSIQKKLFYKEFVCIDMEAENKEHLLQCLCKRIEAAGYVTEEFEQSVMEHEITAPTGLGKGVAIPHGYAKHVIRPVVAVAVLKRPVRWQEDEDVDVVFLLAFSMDEDTGLKEETIKFYSVFLDLFDDEKEMGMIRAFKSREGMAEWMNERVAGTVLDEE